MKYSIVYSSKTGNTKMLAEAILNLLPRDECLYFGNPDDGALSADRIYVGFWTDKGSCDSSTAEFLKKLTGQELFLFGTAGFGETDEYFDKVISRVREGISQTVTLKGQFMCRGKMPLSVRERYEKMKEQNIPNIDGLIKNFDNSLTHPDNADLERLKEAVKNSDK